MAVTLEFGASDGGESSSDGWVDGSIGEVEEEEVEGWEKREAGAKVANPGGVEAARGGGCGRKCPSGGGTDFLGVEGALSLKVVVGGSREGP